MQTSYFTNQRLLNWFLPIIIILYSLLYAPLIVVQGLYHPNQVAVSVWVVVSTWLILGFIGGKLVNLFAYKPRIWNLLDGISSCAVLWASLRMYSLAKEEVVPALTMGKLIVLAIAVAVDVALTVALQVEHKEKAKLHTLRWHYLTATVLALLAIGLNFISSKLRINSEAMKLVSVYSGAYAFKILLASIPKHLQVKQRVITHQIDIREDGIKLLIDNYKARFAYLIYSQLATTAFYVTICLLTEKRIGSALLFTPSAIISGFITTIVGACSATILMHPLAHSACIPLNKLGSLIGAKVGNISVFLLSGLALKKGFTAKDWNLLIGFVAIGLLIVGEMNVPHRLLIAWRKRFHSYRLRKALINELRKGNCRIIPQTNEGMGSRIW